MAVPDDAAIARILAERIDRYRMSVGIVAGVITPTGRRFYSHGSVAHMAPTCPDAHTVFEVGSVTKVFTALLVADMACRGELQLDEPVARLLPVGVKAPSGGSREITIGDVARHVAGLPPMPQGFDAIHKRITSDYTVDDLYTALSHLKLPRNSGERFEYSNFGYALLGAALCNRAGKGFKDLIQSRICQPLDLCDTSAITPLPHTLARCAIGHDESLLPKDSSRWGWHAFAGSGTVLSTADDLLTFLAACLDPDSTPLGPALQIMTRDPRVTDAFYVPGATMPGNHIGLGWMVLHGRGGDIVWHSGGVNGFRAFIGYMPNIQTGVAVLSNTMAGPIGIDDIGFHLLDSGRALSSLWVEVAVEAATLGELAGQYVFDGGKILQIAREGNLLFVQTPEGKQARIFAAGSHFWFLKAVDAQINFVMGPDGRTTGLVWDQGGVQIKARRAVSEMNALD